MQPFASSRAQEAQHQTRGSNRNRIKVGEHVRVTSNTHWCTLVQGASTQLRQYLALLQTNNNIVLRII